MIVYDSYTALFSTVFQDFNLYAFSLRDNLAMSASAEEEKLWEALQIVGLGEKLKNLPGGFSTEIHKTFKETGYEPSGGEGQRLAIARALYKNAPFVSSSVLFLFILYALVHQINQHEVDFERAANSFFE